jgi:tetratricopeptide (TPR) repeat protein
LSSVRFRVDGSDIVICEGDESWEAESGQLILGLDAAERSAEDDEVEAADAGSWYEQGCELEDDDPQAARAAYRKALEVDGDFIDAHLNLGRLLHEAGDLRGAERHYRRAHDLAPEEFTAAFNLGVVLEDLGVGADAISAYERAIEAEPTEVDAYHNAIRLHEAAGDRVSAMRLLKRLRKLQQSG